MTPAGAERIKQPGYNSIRIPSRVAKALSEMAGEMGERLRGWAVWAVGDPSFVN